MKRIPMQYRMLPIAFGIASLGSAAVFAADASKAVASASVGIEEVIITARKTEESQQTVPVSVTALSADALAKQAVLNVNDLRGSVPGLFVANNSQGGAPTFAIRAAKADNGTSNTVTTYIGDMPTTTTRAVANMVYDMQSISVLKGPQGTLFGANSTGGAIVFQPNMPSNVFEGYAEVGIANYDRSSFQGVINIPVSDTIQIRFAGEVVDQNKGFLKVINQPNRYQTLGNDKHESARFSLRIKPNTQFQNDLIVSYFHEDDLPYQDSLGALRGIYVANGLTVDFAKAGIFAPSNPFNVQVGPAPLWNKAKITEFIDTATYEISSNASFKAVLGYEDARLDTFQDNDITPLAGVEGRTMDNLKQWTFEPSIDLKSDDGRLRNKTGLFVSQLQRETGNSYSVLGYAYDPADPLYAIVSPNFPVQSNGYYKREFRSHAIYTQFSYDLTKELTATLGLRYTWDKADYKASNRLGFGLNTTTGVASGGALRGNFFTGPCAAGLSAYQNFNAAACTGEQNIKSQAPSFTFTLEDKFAERSMVYATLRGGYLVGGFNNQVYVPGGFGQTFKPEKVIDVETGIKSDWDLWGRPIRTNLAVFYGNYKNQQRVQNGVTANNTTFVAVQNAGASTFYGLDLDVTYEMTDNLELKAGWNHLETEYTTYNAALNVPGIVAAVDLTGQPMSQAPKDVVNLSATAKWPLAASVGNVRSTLNWYWTDKTNSRDAPAFGCTPNAAGLCTGPSSAAVDFRQYDGLPAYDLWNFTTDWKNIVGSSFDAGFWVKNLTDKKYKTYGNNQMMGSGYAAFTYGPPRQIGINVRYNF